MATASIPKPQVLQVPDDLRHLLGLNETATHYVVRTLSGRTLLRPKSEIRYPWQLLRGIMDNETDTAEEHDREREWERAHDQREHGA